MLTRVRSGQPAPASGTNKASPPPGARGQRRTGRPECAAADGRV